jgi:hypothetical protein
MIIYVANTDEAVRAEITIKYIGTLKYRFRIDGQNYRFPSPGMPASNPHVHLIGMGKDIVSPDRQDTLDIQLINESKKELKYQIAIDWYQGKGTKPIAHYPKDKEYAEGTIKPDEIYSPHLVFDYSVTS